MLWRRLIVCLALLAHVMALTSVPASLTAAPVAVTVMPCHEGTATDGGSGKAAEIDLLPCCTPSCCIGVTAPEPIVTRISLGFAVTPPASQKLVSITVDPADRPPKS